VTLTESQKLALTVLMLPSTATGWV